MNTLEREQLIQFLQQLTQAQVPQKDSEADTLIREACMRQADAAYLLVQRAMLMDHALQNSQTQISRLQGELEQTRNQAGAGNNNGSFLDANAWGNSVVTRPGPTPQTALSPTSPAPAPALGAAPAASAWGSGMLGNIATTAAGVVAGGFLFQGIEHLLGNQGSNSDLKNGLSSKVPPENNDMTASNKNADDSTSNADVFDTSSVDDFIADTDDSV